MPDIDPITREALKRASQMHSRTQRNSQPPPKPQRKSPTQQQHPSEQAQNPPTKSKTESPPIVEPKSNPEPPTEDLGLVDPLKALFKGKDESIILILILLLMDENADSSLLLALMYLLL